MRGLNDFEFIGRAAVRPGSKSDSAESSRIIHKRKAWTRKGVSDIIGNLLILAITVTLFSSILMYVSSMPGPSEKVYSDFTSTLDINSDHYYVNITHKGGQVLEDYKTAIYLFIDNTPMTLRIGDGIASATSWDTGVTWSYLNNTVLTSTTSVSVMIVDTAANTVVYTAPLQGGTQAAMTKPIIGNRGMTPTPVYDGNSVRFYAQISDPYGNLDENSVFLNASSIGLSSSIQLTYDSGLNQFISGYYTANIAWDGSTVLVSATDNSGQKAQEGFTVRVYSNPSGGYGPYSGYLGYLTNGTYPPDASGGEAGGESGITFYYIKRTSDGTITRNFNPGEGVTIELWSDTLANVAGQNTVFLYHPLMGLTPITPQSSINAFSIGSTFSTFRQFVYNFSAPSDAYRYTLQIIVKDNQGVSINLADYITVGGVTYPALETYMAQGSSLVKATRFNHTDELYLIIKVKDTDRYTDTVYISGIEIDDYTGSYVIMKSPTAVPAAGSPLSYSAPLYSMYKTNGASVAGIGNGTSNVGYYTIKIVLKDANQGWWLPNTNFYTLKITAFTDSGNSGTTTGESYSQLSCQFEVTAPLTTTDVAAAIGSGSFTWSSSGATWSDNAISWFEGGDQWNERVIDPDPSSGPLGLTLADLTGDGRNDLVVGAQDTSLANLFWYENEKNDGSEWSSARTISYPFDAYSGTQTAYSTNKGNVNEDASVWATALSTDRFYDGYYSTNEMCAALTVADFNNDGRADVVASFIHVVVYTNAASVGSADYSNSWGMYFNRGVYVFWNDGSSSWTRTVLYSTDAWIAADAANKDTNPAAADLDVADFNLDGYKDIVAVYEDGTTKVWLNQWVSQSSYTGAFSTSNSSRTLPSVTGNLPWSHTQVLPKVEAEDMNGDGIPDVVRTSTLSSDNSVYIIYTQLASASVPYDSPDQMGALNVNFTATVVGPISNLASTNAVYQALTEVNVLYPTYSSTGLKNTLFDTTGSSLSNSKYDDEVFYDVPKGTTMQLYSYYLDASNLTTPIAGARINVQFHVDSGYNTSNFIEYSLDGGVTWSNTTIRPLSSDLTARTATFDITSAGADTYSNITTKLQIRFVNPVSTTQTVHFDYVWVDVDFVATQAVGWIYRIPNQPAAYQTLSVVGHVSGTEGFQISYSPDNETYFPVGQITSLTDVTLSANLSYTPNSYYYIRVTDLDRSVTDVVKSTLYLDKVTIAHNSPTVQWTGGASKIWTSSTYYISALAVGDMKKQQGVYTANEPNDIVVTTGGDMTSNSKLYIIMQSSYGSFSAQALTTSKLAIMCPSSGNYEIHGVELGDLDGDQDLDIILVVGAKIGREQGTGPTLWEYVNNQMSAGAWRFTENPISSVASKGESVINVTTGNIDLAIFLPVFGTVAIVVSSQALGRWRARRK